MEKGLQKGQGELLRSLLVHRFGPLPAQMVEHIMQADSAQLQAWSLRVLDAHSLEAVFAD